MVAIFLLGGEGGFEGGLEWGGGEGSQRRIAGGIHESVALKHQMCENNNQQNSENDLSIINNN